jgi:hypothetical protein
MDTVIAASASFLVMLFAYYKHKQRKLHVTLMVSVMCFDLLFPIYLFATRDWKTRLIDEGDILSFGVWTHFGLLVALFVLYVLQIMAGRRLLDADESIRSEHANLAKGILLTKGLVVLSGMLLIQETQ